VIRSSSRSKTALIGEVGVADYLNVIKKSGNIGIGTSTPSYLLDVNGNVSLNDTLFIDSSSSLVGIGTFSPNALLHIVKDDTINETVSELFLLEHTTSDLSNGTAGIGVALTFRTEDSLANIENISQIQGILKTATDGSEDGELAFLTRSAGGALGERLRIDASGNVGIGTSTPSTNLDVRGLGNFSGTIYINNDTDVSTLGGGGAQWGWSNTTGNVYTTQSSDNVGIGTTTPAYKLEVLDNASISNTLYVTNDSLVGIGNANPNASLEIKDAGEDNDALNVSGVLYVNDSLVRIIATHPDWPIFSLETNTTGSFPDLRVFLSRDDVYFRTAEHLNFETTGDDGTDGASRGVRFKINDNGGFFEVLDDTNMRYFKIDRFGNIGLRSLTSPIYRLQVPDNASFADTLFVTNESTVGIGTSTPANALNVIGDINATGLLYYNGGTQATDFVFDKYFDNNINLNLYPLAKNYSMLPLSELKDFLQTNRHLPGLAGKKLTGQVQAGEINNLLLEKTEEQAIYIVELHDEIKQLKQRLNALENHK
jgi:hypothetical protein